jgi:HAD superfamily hydrolase (TIGR01459 family)
MLDLQFTNLENLLSTYRYFLIDQFGVLHNGRVPYEGAVEALTAIKDRGLQAIIISNSGKRSVVNEMRMQSLGFNRDSYHAMITSGETAWHRLNNMIQSGQLNTGTRCYLLSNDGDTSAIDGLGFSITDDVTNADFIMLSGIRGDTHSLTHYTELLKPAIDNNTLCICTNPDKQALIGNTTVFGAGKVAEEYERLGGQVLWIGKPYLEIYQYCLSQFVGYDEKQKSEVCCIGDSIEHDIRGGHGAGLSTTLVRTGIYQHASDTDILSLYSQYDATADHVMKQFSP